ncbi:FRG domain-containing protein [Ruminococcus sp.]
MAMKDYTKHDGWTVSLYTDKGQNNMRDGSYEYLSWSPYDRIQIHITDDFEKFIFPVDETKWCGVKQQLHLIPYYYIISGQKEVDAVEWTCIVGNEYLVKRNDSTSYYGLQCIVTGRLNYDILKRIVRDALNHEKQDILKAITNNLSQYGYDSNLKFDCISFTTLGSEDFAFMLFADRIETLSELLQIIRQQTIYPKCKNNKENHLFSDICSVIGFNRVNYNYKPTIDAIVKINAKSITAKGKIFKKIKDKSEVVCEPFDILQGINSFEIQFRPKDLTLWHKPTNNSLNENILNGDSKCYKDFISSSRTFWQSEHINVANQNYIKVRAHTFSAIECKDEDKKSTETSIHETQKNNNKNPVFDFILSEYDRMINFSRCVEWKKILEEQRACLRAFDSYYYDTDNEKREFAGGMQAILTHINQACTPIYEVPYHNHFYAGSFDDILKMYYGVIKFIISKGNSINREPWCEPTYFCFGVRFDSVENIQTSSFATENQKERFVIFQLPYSALYDFETSAELLAHEVFHYIAPINRKYRNKQMLNVWMEYLLLKLKEFKKYIDKGLSNVENEAINEIINMNHGNFLDLYYDCMFDMHEDIDIYELSVFTILEFVEEACTVFSGIVSNKLYDVNYELWSKLTEKAKNLSLCDEPDNPEAMDVLRIWLSSNDIFKGMIELVSAVKEIFCDLFMCALYHLDFKRYIMLLKKYKRKQRLVIENDDMGLSYRIMIVAAILRAEYDLEKLSFTLSTQECKLIEDELMDKSEDSTLISELIRSINLIGTSPSICTEIVKTIEKEVVYLKDNFNEFGKSNGKDLKNILTLNSDNIFLNQVAMMNHFINYNDKDEKKKKSTATEFVPHYSTPSLCEGYYYASSLSEYINVMINISRKASGQLWYRGVCNCDFSLIPSLLREQLTNLSLYAMQVNYLKLAYSATINYPDIWKGKIQEHMSLLQHYGMPTNLLDFSLNMLTALHFALNPDIEDDKNKLDNGLWTPIVYAFDPVEYVNAVSALKKEQILPSQYNVSSILYEVADDEMSEFFPTKMDAEFLISHSKDYTALYQPSPRTDIFPVPIIIRHSHDRIRVQGGTFVAFSLNSQPDRNQDIKPYSYIDLKKIESEYENLQKQDGRTSIKKFLYGVRILPTAIKSIQGDIKELNITKSSVYPELQNIFKDVQGRFNKNNKGIEI